MSDAGHRAKERNVKITLDDLIQMDIAPDVGLPDIETESAYRPRESAIYVAYVQAKEQVCRRMPALRMLGNGIYKQWVFEAAKVGP